LIEKTKKLSIVRQLDNDYYDKSNKYLPVTLKSLKIGPFNKSELYLKNSVNGEHNYVLYWKGGDRLFINEKREEFVRKNINKLYVPKNGRKQYLRFIESRPVGVNFGTLVGHVTLRTGTLRPNSKKITEEHIKEMQGVLGTAFRDGAFGISFAQSPLFRRVRAADLLFAQDAWHVV